MHRLSRDYHRRPMRLANAVLRASSKLGISRFELDADRLIAQARRDAELEDFGDERFMEPLRLLVSCLEEEADLNPLGRYINRANILRILKHRLQAQDLITRHPEILDRQFPDPVVIVGLARSGTTRLHRLLAGDPGFVHLESWESVYPVPGPDAFAAREAQRPDPRIATLEGALKAVLYMAPQINAVHPLGTHEIEEEVGLIQHGFSSQLFEIQSHIPSFAEHLMTHHQDAAYEHMAMLLKIVAWFRNDPEDKPWILKTPQHMQDLDALLRVFPGAKLVCPHRDPIKVVGSACSMAWNAIVRDSDKLTPDEIGPHWLGKTERMLRKTLQVRDDTVPPENQMDVLYADITSDWRSAVERIYGFLSRPLQPQALAGMEAWLNQNRQHKHGTHRYSLADFNLSEAEVDEHLMFYRERFDIPYETENPHLKATHRSAGEKP